MNCEQCGGDVYDNRQKVNNGWKGPLFKCKDQDCGWVKWPPKGQRNSGGGAKGGGNGAPRQSYGGRPLGAIYYECAKIASASLNALVKDKAIPQPSAADYIAATATLFIGARDGAPLKSPPPKPKAPEPEPEHEDYGDHDQTSDDDHLPF